MGVPAGPAAPAAAPSDALVAASDVPAGPAAPAVAPSDALAAAAAQRAAERPADPNTPAVPSTPPFGWTGMVYFRNPEQEEQHLRCERSLSLVGQLVASTAWAYVGFSDTLPDAWAAL